MLLFIVRHGETDENNNRTMQGHLNTYLNDTGFNQAKKIAHRLRNNKFSKIYSSDLNRAKHTAEQINENHNMNIIYDLRLRERCFGIYEGMKGEDVDFESLPGDKFTRCPQDGESINDVIYRTDEFLSDFDERGDTLIVSHGGVIRSMLHILLGKSLEHLITEARPKNTGLYVLEKKDNGYKSLIENCDKHLY